MYKRLIPSILIRNGRLVKGRQFTDYKDAGNPATTARAHNYQSADELFVCDIETSKNNTEPDFETLEKVAEECFMPLTICGGINSLDRAEKCMSIGADKIGLTTTALDNPSFITTLAHMYGAQAVVLGIDVMTVDAKYVLYDHRKKAPILDKDPFDWAKEAVDLGVGEIRIMAVNHEGMLNGFDLDLYAHVRSLVNVPIILEGGAGSLDHIQNAYENGVEAIGVGAILVFSDANLVKIKQHMRSKNIAMRL